MAKQTSNESDVPAADAPRDAGTRQSNVPSADQDLEGVEALQAEERARLRRPSEGTKAFKVRVIGGRTSFRRAGIEFNSEKPITVNAKDLTRAEQIELLNTPMLEVEEVSSESKDAPTPARRAGARSSGPAPESLRGPDDAPVPTPTGPLEPGHPAATLTPTPSRPAPSGDREGAPPRDTMAKDPTGGRSRG